MIITLVLYFSSSTYHLWIEVTSSVFATIAQISNCMHVESMFTWFQAKNFATDKNTLMKR